MLDIYRKSLEADGCFDKIYPQVFEAASKVIPSNIPEKMRILMTASELTVFASHLRKPILWHGSTIPVNIIAFLVGGSGCVDSTTEFMTRTGWKSIDEYTPTDEVLSWEQDGTSKFMYPTDYICNPITEPLTKYTTTNIDMVLSDAHNVALLGKTGKFNKLSSKELKQKHLATANGSKYTLPFNVGYPSNSLGVKYTDDELRLHVAYVADGTAPKGTPKVRIRVKKEYKKIALRKLLLSVYGMVEESVYPGEPAYSYFYFIPPLSKEKTFDTLWNVSKSQAIVLSNEFNLWDGGVDTRPNAAKLFRTTKKSEADFVQYIWQATNSRLVTISSQYRHDKTPTHTEYVVRITSSATIGFTSPTRPKEDLLTEFMPDDSKEYCFTMPNGNWVARRNNKIFLTHNSGKGKSIKSVSHILEPGLKLIEKSREANAKVIAVEDAETDGKKPTDWRKYYSKPRNLKAAVSTLPGTMKHLAALERGKLGAGYMYVDEIGSELVSNKDLSENIIALAIGYDSGEIPPKILKDDANQVEGIVNLPYSALMFGSPVNIIYDENVKRVFKGEFTTKISRRCHFCYIVEDGVKPSFSSIAESRAYDKVERERVTAATLGLTPWFTSLASSTTHKPLIVSEEVEDLMSDYTRYNEWMVETIPKQFQISKLHRLHLQWKSLKIAGALAILEGDDEITKKHMVEAIRFSEIFAQDMQEFESELEKEPYELASDYMQSIAEKGYSNMSVHKLRKMGFLKGTGSSKNKLLELLDLIKSYDDHNTYKYTEGYIHYYEVAEGESERGELA